MKKVNIDLGVASIVDVKIKNITLEGDEIFGESNIFSDNLESARAGINTLDIGVIIQEVRDDFERRISSLFSLLSDRGCLPNPPESDKSTLKMIDEITEKIKGDGVIPEDYPHAI